MNKLYTPSRHYYWRQKVPFFLNNVKFISCKIQFICNYSTQIQLSHSSILQQLKHTKPLQQVHAQITVSNLSDNLFLHNRLVNAYASRGLLVEAQIIFSQISNKNVVSWTILLSGLMKNGRFIEAIEVFHEMMVQEIRPNERTIASILPAFGKLGIHLMGKSVHCCWIKHNFGDNVFVETGLVDMYSKFGCLRIARYLFDKMAMRNVVSWNAIISGYSESGFCEEALWMFNQMRGEGFSGDVFTLMSLASSKDIKTGNAIHSLIVKSGYENDQLIKTALMEMYIDCNLINDAYSIFSEINNKDLVAWTLMLRGFSKSGNWKQTVDHFNKMMGEDNIILDSVSLITILSSCSSSGALQQGRRAHTLMIKTGFQSDVFAGSAVIDMYANCSSMIDAKKYFDEMMEKDVACWNTLISGYGMIGCGNKAIELFSKMKGLGLRPNESTFVSLLSACSHSGLVPQGLEIFDHMIEVWNIVPNLKHYACVIDLLGRAGRLKDAYFFMKRMKLQPGIEIYGSLLNACVIYKNFDMGYEIAKEMVELESNDVGCYVLMSNMYALAGKRGGLKMARVFLKVNNLKKNPGFSSIEVNGEMFAFMAGQEDHPHYLEIEECLNGLIRCSNELSEEM